MSLTKRPKKEPVNQDEQQASAFINEAPDAVQAKEDTKGVLRGKRIQITHTFQPAILEKLDKRAEELGTTRASLINLAVAEFLGR